jgi:PAS domain S-box-containing protein
LEFPGKNAYFIGLVIWLKNAINNVSGERGKYMDKPPDIAKNDTLFLKPSEHFGLFYSSWGEWESFLIKFFRSGLQSEEKCVYYFDTHSIRQIRDLLKQAGIDYKNSETSGQIQFRHGSKSMICKGRFNPEDFIQHLLETCRNAYVQGFKAVRFTMETEWVQQDLPGSEKLPEFEKRLEEGLHFVLPCLFICQYDRSKTDESLIKKVLLSHPLVMLDGKLFRNSYYLSPEKSGEKQPLKVPQSDWLADIQREPALCTERTDRKEKLKVHDQVFYPLFDSIANPVAIHDLDFSIRYVNKAMEKITGYSSAELVGHSPPFPFWTLESIKEYNRTGGKKSEDFLKAVQRRFRKKNGELFDVEIKEMIVNDADGHPCYYSVIWTDVTERQKYVDSLREAQEKMRIIFDSAVDGVTVTDIEGNITDINEKVIQLFKLNSKEEVKGKDIFHFINSQDREECLGAFKKVIAFGQEENVEVNLVRADGTEFIGEVGGRALKDSAGKVIGAICVTRDVTDRKLAKQKLEEMLEKEKIRSQDLQEEAKARLMFIDILAHELRTPITPILASTGVLRDIMTDEPDNMKKIVDNIYQSSHILYNRLEELLDLARYSRGTFKLNISTFNLRTYLNDVINRYKPGIEQHGQKVDVDIADDLPEASIDASRLEQVILNLLSNASKFSDRDATIYFKAEIDKGGLLVKIIDHGVGISLEEQEHLFQPYYRAEKDRQKFPGIGLGLVVAKQIIEAHGGKIWLDSQPDRGSTFSFTIPL